MTDRQGQITFQGLSQVIGGTITWNRGVAPSQIQIETTPQINVTQPVGDVTVDFGALLPNGAVNPADPGRVTFTLIDCAVDFSSIDVGNGQTWSLTLFDRRWRWQFGEISGKYNQLKPDGSLDTTTEKTPQQLATLCLEAMGETGYDVSAMPNTARPRVEWDAENPARALASICDEISCDVVLLLDATNSVKIVQLGDGANLPADKVMSFGASLQTGQRPTTLRALTQPVLMQRRLKLYAVGSETDGTIHALFNLSYRPAGGFQNPEFIYDVTGNEDDLIEAQKSIYRWYAVEGFADGTLNLPTLTPALPITTLASVRQIKLTQGLIESQVIDNQTKPQEPRVYGNFYDNDYGASGANRTNARYPNEFAVDVARQLVQFREPVYKINATTGAVEEPDLYIEIAFTLEDENGSPIRYRRDRAMPGTSCSAGVHVERVDSVRRTIRMPYTSLTTEGLDVDNVLEANDDADSYLDRVQARYGADQGDEALYGRIKAINLDGAIQQVVWSIGNGAPATTRAARNRDADRLGESEEKRKRDRRQNAKFAFLDSLAKSITQDEQIVGVGGGRLVP